jgi:hypothetical protein
MLLVAPLPNQRLDLDFHFERTSATAHRSFLAKNATLHAAFGTQYSTKDSRSQFFDVSFIVALFLLLFITVLM